MKTRVLRVDLAGAQGGILHVRRERMGNRITKNAQANRGINVARDIIPILKISECVALGGLHVFHLIPIPGEGPYTDTYHILGSWRGLSFVATFSAKVVVCSFAGNFACYDDD